MITRRRSADDPGDTAPEEPTPSDYERPPLGDLSPGAEGEKTSTGPRAESPLARARDLLRGLAAGAAGAWRGLDETLRRRIAALAILVACVLVFILLIVPLAPCWAPGGDRCAPADDAIALVPEDADAYVHMNLDPDTDQAEAAGPVGERLPELTSQAAGLLALASERVIDFRRDIAPWGGGEIAIAVTAGLDSVDRVLLIEVADTAGAEAFADSYLGDGVSETEVEGITVRTDRRGTSTAIASGFLIAGPEDSVVSTVMLARGAGEDSDLSDNEAYERVEDALPDERLLDAWIAPALAETVLTARDSGLRPFNTFVNFAATEGVGAALTFGEDALGVTIRSAQDTEAAAGDRDFFSNLPDFEPTLADGIGADALAYMGIGNPAESAEALVGRAAATAPDLFEGLEDFDRRLGSRDGVELQDDLLPAADGESALTIEPQEEPGEGPKPSEVPGALEPVTTPYLALLATGVDVDQALGDMEELQEPVASAVGSGSSGAAPEFESTEIAGVEAHSLQISPVVDLTYAGWDDELVVGTSPLAVERARSDQDTLADLDVYRRVTDPLPEQVSMLLYLNTRGLLGLAERLFLGADPTYARLAPDLRTLEAVALAVNSSKSVLATDLELAVGEPVPPDTEPAPIGAEPG